MKRITAFFVFFVSFSVVYVSVAYYLLSPRPLQHFMAFAVYSEGGTLSAYTGGFPLPVAEGQTVKWALEVVNEMGAVQFVRLLYRVGNSTTVAPSSSSPSPNNVPVVGNVTAFIGKEKTSRFELTWTILRKTQLGGSVYLDLVVNGVPTPYPMVAVSGGSFRFLFELWTFDLDTNSFQYGWSQESSRVGSWLQVWFSVA